MDDKLSKAISHLSETEAKAYQKWVEDGRPKLSPDKAAQFFAVFLQGYDCVQISKSNPGFDLGLIVRARVEYEWDERKSEYLQKLMQDVVQVSQKTTAEAIKFASDGMAAFHKLAGEKFRKFLQSGNEEDLGEFKGLSFKNYKDLIEIFGKLTGQESKTQQRIVGEVVHTHTVQSNEKTVDGQATRVTTAADKLAEMVRKK